MDTHMALVNTAALVAAGLMEDPSAAAAAVPWADKAAAVAAADAAGLIDRDPATGLPTGLLRCVMGMSMHESSGMFQGHEHECSSGVIFDHAWTCTDSDSTGHVYVVGCIVFTR
jgi:hypothetical protein